VDLDTQENSKMDFSMEKVEKEDNKKRARKNNNFNFIRFG